MAVIRGCGTRVAGGIYLVCSLSPNGTPLADFIVDPPIPLDAQERADLGVKPIGMTYVEPVYEIRETTDSNGVPNGTRRVQIRQAMLLDWVGETHYPNVQDFLEETRSFGMSRHVSSRFDFSRLVPGTMQTLLHPRAVLKNAEAYQQERMNTTPYDMDAGPSDITRYCPKITGESRRSREVTMAHRASSFKGMCAGLWQEDLTNGEPDDSGRPRLVVRRMPSLTYHGWTRPEGVTPEYEVGIFLRLPISGIEVVVDRAGGKHEDNAKLAEQSGLHVEVVDE
jgi:hypothetical protein